MSLWRDLGWLIGMVVLLFFFGLFWGEDEEKGVGCIFLFFWDDIIVIVFVIESFNFIRVGIWGFGEYFFFFFGIKGFVRMVFLVDLWNKLLLLNGM